MKKIVLIFLSLVPSICCAMQDGDTSPNGNLSWTPENNGYSYWHVSQLELVLKNFFNTGYMQGVTEGHANSVRVGSQQAISQCAVFMQHQLERNRSRRSTMQSLRENLNSNWKYPEVKETILQNITSIADFLKSVQQHEEGEEGEQGLTKQYEQDELEEWHTFFDRKMRERMYAFRKFVEKGWGYSPSETDRFLLTQLQQKHELLLSCLANQQEKSDSAVPSLWVGRNNMWSHRENEGE